MARKPVEEVPMFPTTIQEGPNRAFLIDLDRTLRAMFSQYGLAINDDVITMSDFVTTALVSYTMLDTDRNILADATAAPVIVTLPVAADVEPHVYRIKRLNSGANAVTVQRAGADTIDGATSKALANQYELLSVISDRVSAWHILHWGAP